jgi:hypothetical protein
MALTVRQKRARNAGYQARWREKRDTLARSHPAVAERALLRAAEGCERLSEGSGWPWPTSLSRITIFHRRVRRMGPMARLSTRIVGTTSGAIVPIGAISWSSPRRCASGRAP